MFRIDERLSDQYYWKVSTIMLCTIQLFDYLLSVY